MLIPMGHRPMYKGLLLLILSGSASLASAEVVPLVCELNYENGRSGSKIFSLDLDNGLSDIGNLPVLRLDDSHVSIFWESVACETQRKLGPSENGVCMNNFMFIDRRTLEATGAINNVFFDAVCIISTIENKF